MKIRKFYLMLCALMCGVMAAATALGPSALRSVTSGQTRAGEDSPVYNETTQTGYETLVAALDEIIAGEDENAILIINEDQDVSKRYNLENLSRTLSLTIKGGKDGVKLNRATAANLFLFGIKNGSHTISIEDITIDGKGTNSTVVFFEVSNGNFNLKNVVLTNCNTNHKQGLIAAKGGHTNIENLTIENSTVGDAYGEIFVGGNGVTISGNNTISSIYIEKGFHVNVTNGTVFNGNTPVDTHIDAKRLDTYPGLLISGFFDPSKFNLINNEGDAYYLVASEAGNLEVTEDPADKQPVFIERTVSDEIKQFGFKDFHHAHDMTVAGDNVILTQSVQVTHRVDFKVKDITLKSADEENPVRITCSKDVIFFLANAADGNLTIENIIFDGNDETYGTTVFEIGDNGQLILKNVTIENYNTTNSQGLISIKSNNANNRVTAENLQVINCSVPENRGDIFVGKNLDIKGNCSFTVFLEGSTNINVVGELTNTEAIPVIVGDDRKNTIIVNGCGDESKFSVDCIADFALKATADGQNLELVTTKVVDPEESPVVNRTAKRGYDDLTAAFSAASAGDLIVVKEDQTTTDRLAGKSVTIKGENSADATKPVTIKCTKDNFFFIANSKEGPLTLENLVIDGGGDVAWTKAMLEANGGELALKNVTIRNYNTENDCVISYKDNGGSIVTAENLVIEDCSVKDGGAQVSVGNGKDFEINGNCKFSVHLNGSTSQIIVKEALTNTTPIPVIVADDREGTVIVKGCDDVAKFSISNENLKLEAADGDIKLVSAIVVDPKTKPVYNETTGEGYASLKLAIDEAAGEDVLIVNEDQTVSERISIGEKTLTIKGNSNVAISRAEGLNEIMFLANANGGVLNLENLTLKAPQAREKVLIEASNHGAVSLKNVNLADCEIAKGNLVSIKSGGRMAVENVKTVGCTVPEGEGEIFVGTNSGLDMTGNNSFSVKLEGNAHITAGEITHTVPVKIYLSETPAENRVVVSGCDKPELFSLENQAEGYKLVANNGNIEVEVPAAVEDPEDPGKEDPENPGDDEPGDDDPGKVDPENPGDDEPGDDEPGDDDPGKVDADKAVYNETTGKGYSSLTEAFKAAETDAVLVLKENQTVAERLSADGRVITIKSDDNVTISRDKAYNGMLFLVNSEGGVLNMDNVTIDGCNVESDKVVIEASGHGEVNLIDVTLINCMTTADQGIISIKSGGRVVADCLEILSSSVATGKGEVFVGNSSKLAIVGDCLFTIMHQASGNIDASEATHTSPLSLLLDGEHADGTVVASGNSDLSKFTLLTTGYSLAAEGGNLIVKKDANTGIGMIDFDADEEGVEYYDLQGRRIANPSNGIFIRRKGGETLKVYVK